MSVAKRYVFNLGQLKELTVDPALVIHVVRVLEENPDFTSDMAFRFARAAKRQLQLEMPVNGEAIPYQSLPREVVDLLNERPTLDKPEREFMVNAMAVGMPIAQVDLALASAAHGKPAMSVKRERFRKHLEAFSGVH